MKKLVQIITFGCQMNDLDSLKMYSMLADEGWEPTASTSKADLVIFNTCSVRQKAYEKALSSIGRLRSFKKRKPSLVIAVTGCIAQEKGADIIERMPHVDIVLGTSKMHRIADAVGRITLSRESTVDTEFSSCVPSMDIIPDPSVINPKHRAYINIMQGCNNFCSYCIVPHVRGREISRDHEKILREVSLHATRGVKEIFLLGQNVNSYSGGMTFPNLLTRINAIEGIERIRFTTSHPKDMSGELIDCFMRLDKLCSHVHLPFQSGSDAVLGLMNRQYTRSGYLDLTRRLRSARPDIAFSADVIVGFPGETELDFRHTIGLIEEVRFDILYSFKYSPRPWTRASELRDDIPPDEKRRRLTELQAIQRKITMDKYSTYVGTETKVLVDAVSARNIEQIFGRTSQNTIVNFPGSLHMIGSFVDVMVTRANPNSLTGEMATGR